MGLYNTSLITSNIKDSSNFKTLVQQEHLSNQCVMIIIFLQYKIYYLRHMRNTLNLLLAVVVLAVHVSTKKKNIIYTTVFINFRRMLLFHLCPLLASRPTTAYLLLNFSIQSSNVCNSLSFKSAMAGFSKSFISNDIFANALLAS